MKLDLSNVPNKIGCYLWKDKNHKVIYVGKAKDLQKRMKQYFRNDVDGKTLTLRKHIAHFDYVLAPTEHDALLLELNLINKYEPKYNIKLRQARRYPYIKLYTSSPVRLAISYTYKKDKNKYFGPFPRGLSPRKMVKLLENVYPIATCKNKGKNKPCTNYQIGKCLGYCVGNVSQEKKDTLVKDIVNFFKGDNQKVIEKLNKNIEFYKSKYMYEDASENHDLIEFVKLYEGKQNTVFEKNVNRDVVGFYLKDGILSVSIGFIRNGDLTLMDNNLVRTYEFNEKESLANYLNQFYIKTMNPKEIFLPFELEISSDSIIVVPKIGQKKKIIETLTQHAEEQYKTKIDKFLIEEERFKRVNEMLNEITGLSNIEHIEMIDITSIQGSNQKGAVVSFRNGLPDKTHYRKYNLPDGMDDYRNIYETTYRHFNRKINENLALPDLFIIDGKHQINNARKALDDLGIHVPIIALVKNEKHKTEKIFLESKEEIKIEDKSLLNYLGRIQEEAHRFTIKK